MDNLVNDYKHLFNSNIFLEIYCKDPKLEVWPLQKLHEFWKHFNSSKNLSLLDFGGGPSIRNLISACPYVENIVFSEYVDDIRQEVHNWMDNKGFDWKPTFDFIVQELEGQDQQAAREREEELRSKIKAVISCDLTAKYPLDSSTLPAELCPPYDVVFTSGCVGVVVESDQEFKDAVSKLASLVKPGGYLVMHGDLEESFYNVGKYNFYSFKTSKALVEDSLKWAGINNAVFDFDICECEDPAKSDTSGEFFVYGRRE